MFTQPYSDRIKAAASRLIEADFVLIGAGAGLSAAAGLNYQDPELFNKWYPQFTELGLHTIWEGITAHWSPDNSNHRRFWAFWAHHIQQIRYKAGAAPAYEQLRSLIVGKQYFVITTNVEGQFYKAGFNPDLVFTPQGDYGLFQCDQPCCDSLYENHSMVQRMLANLDHKLLLIRDADIPRCPACGSYLERNLRRDHRFVETPHMIKQPAYSDFVNRSFTGKLVLIEIGVGFNTPSIIRWPFERLACRHPHVSFLRVNFDDASVPGDIEKKSIQVQEDAARVLTDLTDTASEFRQFHLT